MLLDLAVPALEQQRRVDIGARTRELHDAPDAGRPRSVDSAALELDLARHVAAREEQAIHAAQGPVERAAIGEIADGNLDLAAQRERGPLGIADEGAHRHAALAQLAHHVRAHGAGGTCHQNGHRATPLVGGMLTLSRNRFVGS